MAGRLDELAAVAYEAFSRACGSVDPANGCRLARFSQLPARAQGGWRDGVRAVLEDVYREQEAARAAKQASQKPLTIDALDAAVSAMDGIPQTDDPIVLPVHPDSILGRATHAEAVASAELAQPPAGRAGTRKPRR